MSKYDGKVVISTELDNSQIPKGIKGVKGALGGLTNVVKSLGTAIGMAFSVAAIIQFGTESVKAANELSDALTGLQSILEGQGKSFSKAQKFIEEYTSDGLIPATNAITAYKNLASRGYDDSQIQQVLIALKDASAFGRQASYSMGDAVQSATEGLKNENSVLVDNAGVTKNVAKMWEEYAASIGTTANNLTQQQKIQAEVTGILEESKFQTGDAAKVAGTLSGQLQQLSFNLNNLKVAVGNAIKPFVQVFLPIINAAISAVTRFANTLASVVNALFGTSATATDSSNSVADSYSAAADSVEEYGNATSAAAKKAKRALAGFDEITKLGSTDTSGSGGSSGSTSTGSTDLGAGLTFGGDEPVEDTLSPQVQAMVDKVLSYIEPLRNIDFTPAMEAFGRLKNAVEPITSALFSGLEWAWFNILVPLAEWTIEDAIPAFLDALSGALELLNTVIDGLKPLATWLWEDFLQPLAEWTATAVIEGLNGIEESLTGISDWIKENQEGISNFLIILGSLAGSFAAVSALAAIAAAIKDVMLLSSGASIAMSPLLGTIMSWVARIGMVISSAAGWITGTMIPAITGALGAIATALGISVGWVVAIVAAVAAAVAAIIIYWDEICAFFATAAEWFDVNVIQPIAGFFSDLWQGISTAASDCWTAIVEFFTPAIEWFSDLLGSIWQTWSDAFYNIGVIVSGCWEVIKAVWAVVSQWFDTNIISPVADFFSNMWDGIVEKATAAWDGVKSAFSSVASFFGDVFGEAWEKVVGVFSVAGDIFTDIKDGILTAFKSIVNGIIKGLNKVIEVPFGGINTALKKIRDINILGITPFSGLQTISVPQIPYLAQGAVLPANKPFLAMVGDQKHGTNVEAPLATIQEAVALVMEEYAAANLAGHEATVAVLRDILEAVLGIEIGDSVIGAAAARYNARMQIVKGGAR